MKKVLRTSMLVLLAAVFLLTGVPTAVAYSPPYSTVSVGLYYGSSALPSANLQNVTGCGNGYNFGYFDDNRSFVSIGASTAETKISVLRDRNMYYSSSDGRYYAGSSGDVVVGCYHIQLAPAFGSYDDAINAAGSYAGSFVKYSSGKFLVCIGNYISSDAADTDASARGIADYTVTSGTQYTVTVVITGTNTILLEFEYGAEHNLGIMPIPSGDVKSQTWFKGYRYYGGFQYARLSGGDITVANFVNVEDYVKGVIPYEMSASWPLEALKAQALCARTYVMSNLGKHGGSGFDVCSSDDCQVYRGTGSAGATSDEAVDETIGQYITYDGDLCGTYYFSSDGGATENSENVWASALPYLRGVSDPYEADIASKASGYNWTVTYTSDEITSRLQSKGYNCSTIVSMSVSKYTEMGNVYQVTLTDADGKTFSFTKGDNIRFALGVNSIRFSISSSEGTSGGTGGGVYVNSSGDVLSGDLSSYYAIGGSGTSQLPPGSVYAVTGSGETSEVGSSGGTPSTGSASNVFTITGTGVGHSVGMSQWGAYSMAKYHGKTYADIIKFYFTGVTIG